jgi:adhesin HecA-like repeat protein
VDLAAPENSNMAKKFSQLMEESDFTGLVQVPREQMSAKRDLVESFTKVINLMNDRNMSTHKFKYLMSEAATTSDFPLLLGMVLDQSLIAQYKMVTPDWEAYIATGLQSDFRNSQLVKLWGLEGALQPVPEHGEYPEITTASGKVQMQLKKYGKAFGLTWEDVLNDRLGVFSDAAKKLADSARRTEYRGATQTYSVATGPSPALFAAVNGTIAHPVDGVAITNSTNLPLNAANLATVMGNIRRQRDAEGEPIFFDKIHLVVPGSLEIQARRILNPGSLIVSGGDATAGTKGVTQTSTNILTQYNIVLHVNPYLEIIDLTGNAKGTWYVFVDKADAPAVQFNRLRNHESPEVFMKASNSRTVDGGAVDSMEGSFEDDTLWWKVRHVFGSVALDPRAAYASINNTVPTS